MRLANAQRNSFTFCGCFFFASPHFIKTKLNQLYIKLRREIYNKIIFIAHYHRITVRFAKLTKNHFFHAYTSCFSMLRAQCSSNVKQNWTQINSKISSTIKTTAKAEIFSGSNANCGACFQVHRYFKLILWTKRTKYIKKTVKMSG